MDGNDVWLLESELAFVGIVGGLGWVIALVAIEQKRKREQWSAWQTVDEFLRVTFTSITFVAAVQLAVQIAIHLPGWLENRRRDAIEEIVQRTEQAIDAATPPAVPAAGVPTMPRVPSAEEIANEVGKRLDETLGSRRPEVGFLEAAAQLRVNGTWNERELQRLVDVHFRVPGAKLGSDGRLYIKFGGAPGDGGFDLTWDGTTSAFRAVSLR